MLHWRIFCIFNFLCMYTHCFISTAYNNREFVPPVFFHATSLIHDPLFLTMGDHPQAYPTTTLSATIATALPQWMPWPFKWTPPLHDIYGFRCFLASLLQLWWSSIHSSTHASFRSHGWWWFSPNTASGSTPILSLWTNLSKQCSCLTISATTL